MKALPPDCYSINDLCQLLSVPESTLRRKQKEPGFPEPYGYYTIARNKCIKFSYWHIQRVARYLNKPVVAVDEFGYAVPKHTAQEQASCLHFRQLYRVMAGHHAAP